jgi:hypothetical protein
MFDRQKVVSLNHVYMFITFFILFFFGVVNFIDIFLFAYVQGIGDAVDHLLPYAEHRFYVRHLHAHFKG